MTTNVVAIEFLAAAMRDEVSWQTLHDARSIIAAEIEKRFSPDQPRDESGRFASAVGGAAGAIGEAVGKAGKNVGSALMSGVRSVSHAFQKLATLFKPNVVEKTSMTIPVRDAKRETFANHIKGATEILAGIGVKDVWNTDLQKSAIVRSEAVKSPGVFEKKMETLEFKLKQALQFSDGNRWAQDGIREKLDQIKGLTADVAKFRASQELQELPAHFGKKGAAATSTKAAIDHLALGGDAKSAVKHVMKVSGVKESTAKRYVSAAIREAKKQVDENILQMKQEVKRAG